jgi:pimeloyl-ACP methyl ester carboxylesterase
MARDETCAAFEADQAVFEGEHLRACLMAGTRDRLIVTFDHRKKGRAGFNAPRHSSTFARGGFWQLNIQTRENDWFINSETAALETALKRLRGRFGRVNLMGFSMGGYGALRFARALGADQVVIISPQFSIARDVVPFERRFHIEAERFCPLTGDLARAAVPELRGLILVDPFHAVDMKHVAKICRLFPQLELARLGFAGHPATQVIRTAGRIWALHREITATQGADRRLICDAHRDGRRESPGYWERLATRAEPRRPAVAAHARERAAALLRAGVRDRP